MLIQLGKLVDELLVHLPVESGAVGGQAFLEKGLEWCPDPGDPHDGGHGVVKLETGIDHRVYAFGERSLSEIVDYEEVGDRGRVAFDRHAAELIKVFEVSENAAMGHP